MKPNQVIKLVTLSAIWGASFMFMRYLAPMLGPVAVADMRVLIAGAALCGYFAVTRFPLQWKTNWKHFLVIGAVNSGLPFLLYSFAAIYIPASLEVIFNALAPLFAVVFGAIWLREKINLSKISGLVLGVGGVICVSGLSGIPASPHLTLAILACVAAPACYGLAGIYIKKRANAIEPKALAAGSQLSIGIALFPAIAASPPPATALTLSTAAVMTVFAILCSAIAYLMYYSLISEIGPQKTLTVTLLMPVFGIAWGILLLSEHPTLPTLFGTALILLGTWLLTRTPQSPKPHP